MQPAGVGSPGVVRSGLGPDGRPLNPAADEFYHRAEGGNGAVGPMVSGEEQLVEDPWQIVGSDPWSGAAEQFPGVLPQQQ